MIHHIGLSALLDWNLCQRRHYFARTLHLSPKVRPVALGSGGAVHKVIAQWLYEHSGVTPTPADLEPLVVSALWDELGAGRYQRYVKGAMNAIANVPAWVWDRQWEVEAPVDIELRLVGGADVVVHGRVDAWSRTEEGVEIMDFKVSDADPLDLMLWSPQIRYYALGLRPRYVDCAVHYRYITLPTKGQPIRDNCAWPFTTRLEEQTRADLTDLVTAYLSVVPQELATARPLYNRVGCGFCDFKPICTAIITGVSHHAVMKEGFIGAK